MLHRGLAILCTLGSLSSISFAAPATQPSREAWPLYQKAIERVNEGYSRNIDCPAASDLAYPGYPPYPAEWHKLEDAAYAFNAPARALAHEARSRNIGGFPELHLVNGKLDVKYLNGCRALSNDMADASLQEHLRGDDAKAIETLRDLLHLSELLDDRSTVVQTLVSLGVRAIALDRLEIITSNLSLGGATAKAVSVDTARELIRRLFEVNDRALRYNDLLQNAPNEAQFDTISRDRIRVQVRRVQTEGNLAAMSLACHLFRLDKGRWPDSIQELTSYLPAPPRDFWGPMGYAVIERGTPDGRDRPLIYSRCNSKDGLFYLVDEPQFDYYPPIRIDNQEKQGGQFRDVTLWQPAHPNPAPATRPLE